MSVPDHASPTLLDHVSDVLLGRKLLLSGRMMSYDPNTGLVLLSDKGHALLVDVALCIDRPAKLWVQDNFRSIQVIGHLEKTPRELPAPSLPPHLVTKPKMDTRLVLRAIRVIAAFDIEQDTWNRLAERVSMHAENVERSILRDSELISSDPVRGKQ